MPKAAPRRGPLQSRAKRTGAGHHAHAASEPRHCNPAQNALVGGKKNALARGTTHMRLLSPALPAEGISR
jgi:hypothetical protein